MHQSIEIARTPNAGPVIQARRSHLGSSPSPAIESLPVAQLPGEAAGAVGNLIGAEDLLVLRSYAGLNPADNVCNARHVDRHLLSRGVLIWRNLGKGLTIGSLPWSS